MLSIVGTLSAENIKYKNVIIFGDSLSDTGNMPKSGSVSSGVEPPMNYILPVTNPISFSFMGKEIALPKYAGESVKWSVPSKLYAEKYHQKNDKYSFNWVDYLLYNTYRHKDSQMLINWVDYHSNSELKINDNTSFNYSFVTAMSQNGYANPAYTLYKDDLTTDDIVKRIQNYKANPTQGNFDELAIPGVARQVELYIDDYNKDPVLQNNEDTAYIIWIGGNDLSNAMQNKLVKGNLISFYNDIGTMRKPGLIANNISTAVKTLEKKVNAKHIYVANVFNIGKVPFLQSYSSNPAVKFLLANIAGDLAKILNNQIKTILLADSNVKVINMAKYINTAMSSKQFNKATKAASKCVDTFMLFPQDVLSNNCYAIDHMTIDTFWNGSHFAQPMNQLIAYKFKTEVFDESFSLKDETESSDIDLMDDNFKNSVDKFNQQSS